MKKVSTFPLQRPVSIENAVEKLFTERKAGANPEAAIAFLTRKGGEEPRGDDRLE